MSLDLHMQTHNPWSKIHYGFVQTAANSPIKFTSIIKKSVEERTVWKKTEKKTISRKKTFFPFIIIACDDWKREKEGKIISAGDSTLYTENTETFKWKKARKYFHHHFTIQIPIKAGATTLDTFRKARLGSELISLLVLIISSLDF